MKGTESSERCKVIIVNEGSGEVLAVNMPYRQDTLLKVLRDSLKHYNITADTANEVQLTEKYSEHVFVRKGYGHKKVAVRDIAYLEADRNYCRIQLFGGECMNVSMPMVEVYEYLSPDVFKRIHRSFIVNLEYIDTYIGNMITLKCGKEITIGREYRETIRNEFVCIGSRKRIRMKNKLLGG